MLSVSSHLLRFEPLTCSARNNNNANRKFSHAATGNCNGMGETFPAKNKIHLLCVK